MKGGFLDPIVKLDLTPLLRNIWQPQQHELQQLFLIILMLCTENHLLSRRNPNPNTENFPCVNIVVTFELLAKVKSCSIIQNLVGFLY